MTFATLLIRACGEKPGRLSPPADIFLHNPERDSPADRRVHAGLVFWAKRLTRRGTERHGLMLDNNCPDGKSGYRVLAGLALDHPSARSRGLGSDQARQPPAHRPASV